MTSLLFFFDLPGLIIPLILPRNIIGSVKQDDEEVQKFTRNFLSIRAVLDEAENRQVKHNAVAEQLKSLYHTSYDIENALDEWNTEIQQVLTKVADASNPLKKVRLLALYYLFTGRHQVLRRRLDSKLKKLKKTLLDIAPAIGGLNFTLMIGTGDIEPEPKVIAGPMSVPSVIDPSEVYGRGQELNTALDLLLGESSQAPTLPIITILGSEGIGKTRVARMLFDNDVVKAHFEKRIWVCASHLFDEIRIVKEILESLKGFGASNFVDMETVLQQISQYVQGKKFLLVLDDVWINHPKYWEQLMYSLKSASEGSRILLTTREENVADKMGTSRIIQLGRLSEKDCWSLFHQVAFFKRESDEYERLAHIGIQIVGKCKGSPFAVKILGSLLRFKENFDEWRNVLGSEQWKFGQVENEHFLPLLVSYYDLPPTLRKCFLYCAIFPKNYEIEKDRLIKLWMAQGFLKVEERGDMELLGEKYFENLAARSFFQDFQRNEFDGKITSCKMHNIVHDFAQFLTKNECSVVEANGSEKGQLESSYNKIQHLMVVFERQCGFPVSIYKQKRLRSLVVKPGEGFMTDIVLRKLFDQLMCLRTLDLSNQDTVCYKVIRKVPREIKNLIHLRYLNLSHNSKIKKLPETLCELYNLETIELSWCTNLKKLPQGMRKLINLRHVINDGTSLCYMPKGIERLTCLRSLREFIVSGGNNDKASKLECLKHLSHLGGSLSIKKLGNVNRDEVETAELKRKKSLIHLFLSFEKDEEKGRMKKDDEDALEGLQPPPNLESLEISYYRGNRISLIRIMSLTKLRSMTLDKCMNLEQLPRFGELPFLESLAIRSMRSVEKVGNEFLGIDQSSSTGKPVVVFPHLKSLEFQRMKEWKDWSVTRRTGGDIKIMPCLCSLTIEHCPKLETLPKDFLPGTLDLKIISCPMLEEGSKNGTAESN